MVRAIHIYIYISGFHTGGDILLPQGMRLYNTMLLVTYVGHILIATVCQITLFDQEFGLQYKISFTDA